MTLRLPGSWADRLSLALIAAAATALWWFAGELTLATQALLWGGLLATLAFLSRQGWLRLFGPVLFYDLVRIGRRGRFFFLRCLYGVILFAVLCWMSFVLAEQARWLNRGQESPAARATRLAEAFFGTFMTVQIFAVLFMAPAYAAGAIAEEKDRRTLEFILATSLEDREIVLSKLASRLLSLTMILLVGLPIMTLLQFLGGIDPEMVLVCFLATGLTMTSLASVSILASVYARKTRDALGRVYMGLIAYLILLPALEVFMRGPWAGVGAVPLWFSDSPPTILSVVQRVNHGHIFMAYGKLLETVAMGGRLAQAIENVLADYVGFHVVVIAVCTTWAVLRLRPVALRQAGGAVGVPAKSTVRRELRRRRPPVGDHPMLWKEVYAESGARMGVAGRIMIAVLVLASFVPAAWTLHDNAGESFGRGNWEKVARATNTWVRIAGPMMACLLWLTVAGRAAGSIGGERDKNTLVGLLTSPLSSGAIYFAKWWGAICSVRWGLLWLAAVWTTALFLGGLKFFAMPLLAAAWLVPAGFFAAVGMWFSAKCPTTGRATLLTMLVSLFCGGLNWLIFGMCCCGPLAWSLRSGNSGLYTNILEFHAVGMTPPFTIGWLALKGDEFERRGFGGFPDGQKMLTYAVVGLGVWSLITIVLYRAGLARFRKLSGRGPRKQKRDPRAPPLVEASG